MRKLVSRKSSVVSLFRVLWMILLLLQLQFCLSITTATCIQKEREALLQFKNNFYYDPSHRLASWNNGTDCCNWKGVGCNQITGHVTIIDLRSDDYQVDSYNSSWPLYSNNSIDSSLLELKYLNYLDLSGNHFNFTQIPSFLGSMVELTYLNLSNTIISGKVPPHLGNLTKLKAFDLSFNYQLQSNNGDVEWISHLSSLQFLGLTDMDFSKSLNLMQVLSSLIKLSSLILLNCSLQNIHFSLSSSNYSSFLSKSCFNNEYDLQVLTLRGTSMRTKIPDWLGKLKNMKSLNLGYSKIYGPIPASLGNLSSLEYLYLSGNALTGAIPTSFGRLLNLRKLYLSNNRLEGVTTNVLSNLEIWSC
ncbi:hypothetical protein IC582_022096 [Cucumis melo]